MVLFPDSESSCLEFKRTIPAHDQILKTAVGFCNQHGGRIIIGVSDNREVTGIDEQKASDLLEYLHKTIYKSCSPPIVPDIYSQRIEDRLVLVVSISPGSQKPYFVRSAGVQQGTYIRLGRSTVRADPETIADLQRQARGISFDMTPVFAAPPDALDKQQVKTFLENRPVGFKGILTRQILSAYHLVVEEQSGTYASVAGLLLFTPDPQHWFPESMIVCSRFSGVSGREAVATKDFTGSLLRQYGDTYDFILSHLDRSFTVRDKKRIESFDVPAVAVREALVNMIAHRNYAIAGPGKIAIYDDRIEFFSPGVFPGPIDTANLGSGITYIRNTAIARVLREAGYIEKLGTGFLTMIESCAAAGLPDPTVVEGTNFVKCILYRQKRHSPADESGREMIRTLFCADREIGVSDVVRTYGISRATAVRRLSGLQKNGLVKRIGAGAATRYVRNRP